MPDCLVRPVRFAVVGVANTIVDVGVFSALVVGAAISPVLANLAGYAAGTINSYACNRGWTFADTTTARWRPQFARFVGVNIVVVGISTGVVWTLAPMIGPLPAKLVSVVATFAFSYTLSRTFVFSGRHEKPGTVV